MRIPKSWVPIIAKKVIDKLIDDELIEPAVKVEELKEVAEALILDELMVEDRLNEEVRELLKKHEYDIDKGRLDYRKLFDLTKQKLVRERNLVL